MKETDSVQWRKLALIASSSFLAGGMITRLLDLFIDNETLTFLFIMLCAFPGSFLLKARADLILRTAYFFCLIVGAWLCIFQLSMPVLLLFLAFLVMAMNAAGIKRLTGQPEEIQALQNSEG